MLPVPAHVDRWSAPTKLVLSETLLKEETERVPRDRTEETAISFGPFRLLPKARLLEKDGAPVHVGGRALDILILLRRQERTGRTRLGRCECRRGQSPISCHGLAQGARRRRIGRALCCERAGPRLLLCRADRASRASARRR